MRGRGWCAHSGEHRQARICCRNTWSEDGEGGRASALVAGMGKREVTDSVCEWEEKGRSK